MLIILMCLVLALCTACTALPAEERAFAVVLAVENPGPWRVHARVPNYQSGGGYLTVTGEGNGLTAALADMEAHAPMQLHLSQLRLLTVDLALAASGELPSVLHDLSDRVDMRQECTVALTDVSPEPLMEALEPATGARLSKSIDVLIESRVSQGQILPAELSDVIRMGERQAPVLPLLTLEDREWNLSGGVPLTADLRPGPRLTASETALLSLLTGRAKTLQLTFPDGSARVRDASCKAKLAPELSAEATLTLRVLSSTFTPDGLEARLAADCQSLLTRLYSAGCDVLGLGRLAIMHAPDMAAWHDLSWPQRISAIRWTVRVGVDDPA